MTVKRFEKLASGVYLEGLAVDRERDFVWYSDVVGGGIHGLKANGERVSFDPDRRWTGGVTLNRDGSVLSSGPGGIRWNNPHTGDRGWLIHEIDGQVINGINEMAPDGSGGLFFGTCDLDSVIEGRTPQPTAIYRLTPERDAIEVADGIGFANGLMFDPKRRTLYCNDTFTGTWAFDVDAESRLANKRLLLRKKDADGLALDADGNVWLTGFESGSLARISAAGNELPAVATPGRAITQVRFGGADLRDCYINTVPADGGDSLKEGREMTGANSHLYRGRSEVPGMPLEPASFTLI